MSCDGVRVIEVRWEARDGADGADGRRRERDDDATMRRLETLEWRGIESSFKRLECVRGARAGFHASGVSDDRNSSYSFCKREYTFMHTPSRRTRA